MSGPSEREVRLRCIEAAARAPMVHAKGPAAGVLETADVWAQYVIEGRQALEVGVENLL